MTAAATTPATINVALIGNPNTGKSTLFNALSGGRVRTGNYPGVTVEKKSGRAEFHGRQFKLIDLPGTYSLAPRSPDEMVAVDVLLGRRADEPRPDVVLCIVDASNLERNFYLLSQVLELGLPTVVAVNMIDLAESRGLKISLDKLAAQVPVKFVAVQANQGKGIDELKQAIATVADTPTVKIPSPFPQAFQDEVRKLIAAATTEQGATPPPAYLAERLLLDTSGYLESGGLAAWSYLKPDIAAARERLLKLGIPVPAVEAMARYQWAAAVLKPAVVRPKERPHTFTDKVDRWLTDRFLGTLVFFAVMFVLFQAVSLIGEPAAWATDWAMELANNLVNVVVAEGPLRSLLTNGVVAGVGGVIVFVPQILTLFLFIAVLEDCGYMARAAYLMDKLMVRVGLSGKSFIPLLSSFACAIPGIMAARVIENRRDRLVTILVAPLMSCSARVPVYVLLIETFFADHAWYFRGLMYFLMYSLGAVVGIGVAWILKLTILRGPTPPFVLELPSYKWPGLWIVLHRMIEQGGAFVYRAGTLILLVAVVVWALAYYPRDPGSQAPGVLDREVALSAEVEPLAADYARLAATVQNKELEEDGSPKAPELKAAWSVLSAKQAELADVQNHIAGTYLEASYLGQMGKAIEPAVKPLGWDWKLGAAAIASFPAREVIVATLGTIYNLGEGVEADSIPLREQLREAKWAGTERKVYNVPVALSIMVFFALCAQCASTLAIMKRETGSYWWPLFTFVYMTGLAYVGALIAYQGGMWLGL